MKPEIIEDGLSKAQIQTDVELKLMLAGIKLLSSAEQFIVPGWPVLYINLNTLKIKDSGVYSFNVLVELNQDVYLGRNPNVVCTAATWSVANVGYVGKIPSVSFMRGAIKDLVDVFINAYLSVNPK